MPTERAVLRRVSHVLEFGDGRCIELEINEDGEPEITLSEGIPSLTVWTQQIHPPKTGEPLRVVIEQREDVTTVQAKGSVYWWRDNERAPMLELKKDGDHVIATASADNINEKCVPQSNPKRHEIELGRIRLS